MSNTNIKETLSILNKVKNSKLTPDKAQRLLFVLFGVSKSACCRLD